MRNVKVVNAEILGANTKCVVLAGLLMFQLCALDCENAKLYLRLSLRFDCKIAKVENRPSVRPP